MYHWYSVNATTAGINNEMASVTVFLEAYENTPDYDVLNRIICEWREAEEKNRDQCGLPSVNVEYPGCFFNQRGHGDENGWTSLNEEENFDGLRGLRHNFKGKASKPLTAHDIIVSRKGVIVMEDEDYDAISSEGFDWESLISSHYIEPVHQEAPAGPRRLVDFDHVGPWFNYFPLLGVSTKFLRREQLRLMSPHPKLFLDSLSRFGQSITIGEIELWIRLECPMLYVRFSKITLSCFHVH